MTSSSLREAVLLGGIAAILDGSHVRAYGVERRVTAHHVVLHEARHPALRDAEHVVQHEDLAVDPGTGADADDGHLHCVANRGAERRRHALEQQSVGARALELARIFDHALRGLLLASLYPEAAQLVHGLRLQTE